MEQIETQLPVRKFRVLQGVHVQGKRTYAKGKIVKSDKDLATLFVGKFVEVGKRDDEEVAEASDKAKTTAVKTGSRKE